MEPIPIGSLLSHNISIEFAVYYLPKPRQDALAEVHALLQDKFKFFTLVEKITGDEAEPCIAARLDLNPQQTYTPPDLNILQRFGPGLSREQAEAMQTTEQVLILDFHYPSDRAWEGLRSASEFTSQVATATGGLPWDEQTRQAFSLDAWQKRTESWTEGPPNILDHIVIHAYNTGEYVRAVSLGMSKFGLPDVVIDKFSWSLNKNMGHILNLFAQKLAEGATITRQGEFDLDIRTIIHPEVRESQLEALQTNATGIAALSLRKGTWEEGDPQNRLIEITFERGEGPDLHARQMHVASQAFGFEDHVSLVKHDEELEAAGRKARMQLPTLREQFTKGLGPGEYLLFKAPFARPDEGNEWMWVEVTTWDRDKITGLLKNEPFYIPTLHAGQIVRISESDVLDYIYRHADGTSEGNETGKVIERREKGGNLEQ